MGNTRACATTHRVLKIATKYSPNSSTRDGSFVSVTSWSKRVAVKDAMKRPSACSAAAKMSVEDQTTTNNSLARGPQHRLLHLGLNHDAQLWQAFGLPCPGVVSPVLQRTMSQNTTDKHNESILKP